MLCRGTAMAQIMSLYPAIPTYKSQTQLSSVPRIPASSAHTWTSLSRSVNCKPRFSCLFSDNRKQEEVRKALESALGGKKTEFEKWDKEIKRREEAGGGGNSGGGGWFGWFGGSGGDHFWQEAQQVGLTILGLLVVYLIVAKGDLLIAVIFNPLLFALRGPRTAFSLLIAKIKDRVYNGGQNLGGPKEEVAVPVHISAKESVVRKWGSN